MQGKEDKNMTMQPIQTFCPLGLLLGAMAVIMSDSGSTSIIVTVYVTNADDLNLNGSVLIRLGWKLPF